MSQWQRCDALPLSGATNTSRDSRGETTKLEDRYLKFIRWSDEDQHYIGYCPDLFPWGGVCHGLDEEKTYRQLRQLIREEVKELTKAGAVLPDPVTRPMREVMSA